jgi:glycosyltransferase involved in cell wall biosynthesis
MGSQVRSRFRRTPRVALCFGTYPPDRNGGADFLERFSDSLAALDVQVTVITSAGALPEREQISERVTIFRIVDDWTIRRTGRCALARVNRVIAREQAEIIHVFFPDSVVQSRYQLPFLIGAGRVPLVTTFWGLGLGRRSPLPVKLESLMLLARSRALSSHDPTYLRILRRVAARRSVAWLPVGNNLRFHQREDPRRTRARHGATDGSPLLSYFGQLDETRGIEELMQALAVVRPQTGAHLIMVGSAGRPERYAQYASSQEAYERYVRLPERLGVADAVTWTEYLPDAEAAALLQSADLCVLPYRRNSLGRSALAAAFELEVPVVLAGSDDAIAPLRAEKHVAQVPTGDAETLASTIVELLRDDARRERLRAGAREAARLFAWPRIAALALDMYARVLPT